MFPPATLEIAQRLIASLMTLIRAAVAVATDGGTPTLTHDAAHTLFSRLSALVLRIIDVAEAGIRPPPKPRAPAAEPPAAEPCAPRDPAAPSTSSSGAAPTLPRRPGWLLAALPDTAPDVAAEIRALLDDPALAPLLLADATLNRALAALLRSLGLPEPVAPPSPDAPPQAPAPRPTQSAATPAPAAPTIPQKTGRPGLSLSYA